MNYEQSLKDYRDWQAVMAFAEKKGEEKGVIKSVKNLLHKKSLTPEQISEAFDVSLDFVLQTQKLSDKHKKRLFFRTASF